MTRAIGLLVLALLSACASKSTPSTVPTSDPPKRYQTDATILEAPGKKPMLCIGVVLDSLPPQCGGPEIVNWSWLAVGDEQSANGTTWGEYHVVGTYDGERFTLTDAPGPLAPAGTPSTGAFAGPCRTPPGGWTRPVPSRAGGDDQTKAIEHARRQPDFAGVWIDSNGTGPTVLNVKFTGDLERHETEIEQIWGGALCVSKAQRTLNELRSIERDVTSRIREFDLTILSSSVDEVGNVVALGVIVEHDDTQDRLDQRYGKGVIRIEASLKPVE
jgi:hypothetical protein